MTTFFHRGWLRFRLRTLFIGVALVACLARWVMYQQDWIRQRHDVLEQVHARDVLWVDDPALRRHAVMAKDENRTILISWVESASPNAALGQPDIPAKAPLTLRPFGEPGVALVSIVFDAAQSRPLNESEELERTRIQRLFPEAHVTARAKQVNVLLQMTPDNRMQAAQANP